MGLSGAVIAPFSDRKYLEKHWVRMGRGSGVSRPREQPKALPALAPIQTLEKTPCLPCSWSLTGTPGTILDVRAGKLSGDNDHSHSEQPTEEEHPRKPRHLVTPQPPGQFYVFRWYFTQRKEKPDKKTCSNSKWYCLICSTVSFLGVSVSHAAG